MKKLGSILLIAGTSIGAGMLGIPYAVAAVGFKMALALLFINWIIMFMTALLLVEVNIRQPLYTDLNVMALSTLGRSGQMVTLCTYLLLLYLLITAYIAMGGALINQYIFQLQKNSGGYSECLFVLILGLITYCGTLVVDHFNKFFFALKTIIFVGIVILTLPHVQVNLLCMKSMGVNYIWFAFPILITSFGFHIIIPTVRNYLKNDSELKKTVAIGAAVPFAIYLIWIIITIGVIPVLGDFGFKYLMAHNIDLGKAYQHLLNNNMLSIFIVGFSNIALITSALGVTLALFHFNQDVYRLKNSSYRWLLNLLITYVPPCVFAIFFVEKFLVALGYAGIFVCILLIILPACMTWSLRNKEGRNTLKSKLYLSLLIILGIFIILLQILSSANLLSILA